MLKHSLQLSGMTFRARGRRSSKEASRTRAWTSGYDMAAQVAEKGRSFEPNHRTEFQWSEWNVCVADVVPVNPPIDQAKMTMSLSWKPSLWTANWITTSMALASFWGKGTPWERQSDNNGQTTTVRQQQSDNNSQTTGESVMVNVNSHSFQQVVLSLLWLQADAAGASHQVPKTKTTAAYCAASKARVVPAQDRVAPCGDHVNKQIKNYNEKWLKWQQYRL